MRRYRCTGMRATNNCNGADTVSSCVRGARYRHDRSDRSDGEASQGFRENEVTMTHNDPCCVGELSMRVAVGGSVSQSVCPSHACLLPAARKPR